MESEIRTEHLSSTLAIVRRVVTFLETSTQVQLTAQNSISGTRWFQLVEIHWESKCRVLRLSPPLDCKFTNSSGRKTIIQVLRDDFDPLEILYLRAAWPRQSGIHIQLQPQSSGKTAAYIE